MSHSRAVPSAAADSADHSPLDGRGSMQHPAATAADGLDATPGTVRDAGQGNQSDIDRQSETDEDSNYAEERWAAEDELDNLAELPFAAAGSSSEDEEEDQFYFITTRYVWHIHHDVYRCTGPAFPVTIH